MSGILSWLYPPKCIVCLEILPQGAWGFCKNCADAFSKTGDMACDACGIPIGACDGRTELYKSRGVYVYDDAMRRVIHAFKYGGHPAHGRVLGKIMGEELYINDIDIIVPVPLHKRKEHERGFNQSEILAREIARHTQIPCDGKSLIRVKNTAPQSGLGAEQRRSNLTGAFRVRGSFAGKRVLVVDDIYTTGSTLKICAEQLIFAGAAAVYGYTLAVTVLSQSRQSLDMGGYGNEQP